MVVLRQRKDADARSHPTPAETLLVIEPADGTRLRPGRDAELYAPVGVADYRVVDLATGQVRVDRRPRGDEYGDVEAVAEGLITPRALPDGALAVTLFLT